MTRIAKSLLALTVLLSLMVTPVAAKNLSSHPGKHQFSVGVVLDVGGVNDKSFNHLAYLGLQQARVRYHVKAYYVVSTGVPDYVPNLTNFAQKYDLTIGVGFLMQSAMYQVAKEYPRKKFAMVDGCPTLANGNCANLSNVADLFFREQQSGYCVGVIAGLMEKNHIGRATHNTIGYMGGVSIPPVNRYIAGYIQGARHVDPGIHILSGYSQSFTDQTKGNQIGRAQISQGADILFQVAGASGLGYLAAAQQESKYGIGVDANQGYLGSYVITSAIKKVDVAVRLTVHAAITGFFKGGMHHFDLRNNATGFSPASHFVPKWIVRRARAVENSIRAGTIVPSPNIPK